MAIVIYGGSFDPPHVGHVLATQYVLSVGLGERVVVVPVFRHAFGKVLTDFDLRLKMCELAFCTDARVSVSPVERELPEPSYTLQTVKALRAAMPGEEFRLLIGADVLPEIRNWHHFGEVSRLAPPLVLGRAGVEGVQAEPAVLPQVSSTEARTWWRSEASDHDKLQRQRLIPKAVRELIDQFGLYQGQG